MEPESSYPCLQETATGPYPELNKSSPHPPMLFTGLAKINTRILNMNYLFTALGIAMKPTTLLSQSLKVFLR